MTDDVLGQSTNWNVQVAGETVIEPPRGISLRLREVWHYRDLAWFLLLRSIKPRYRQTVLGLGWAILPPLVQMLVFTVFLNRAAGIQGAHGIPYPVFSYAGLLIWTYFAGAVSRGGGSLLGNAGFLTKVYFPRMLIPLTSVLAGLFDLVIAFVVLVPLMAVYGVAPSWHVVALPGFIVLATVIAFAMSLWLTAASVQYRDLSLAVPLAVQVWMFATPVIYPITTFPKEWRTLVSIVNPMAPVVSGFRWALLGTDETPGWELAGASVIGLALLAGGLVFFNRMERTFADEI